MTAIKKPELMAPAGDMISLRAALEAGADAVYFGVSSMNMRSSAKNFANEQMPEIAKLCHEYKAKAYLTLNTIVFDHELKEARQLVALAAKANIDAVICWDYAIIEAALAHKITPFMSTQMSVANSAALKFMYQHFGIRRFVLARECTLDEIKSIRANLELELKDKAKEIEIEVFAHGAMCVSVSGRCFLSQFHFKDSGNRGECKQPCRREYLISEVRDGKSYVLGQDYLMSPKDLCSLPFLEQILEAGIDSLKIEGRGRSPEYVSTVTSCYRKFIDFYFARHEDEDFVTELKVLKEQLLKELHMVFHRGFSDGYFFGRQIEEWTGGNGSKATHRKVQVGVVTNFFKKPMVAEIKIVDHEFTTDEELMFQGAKTGVVTLRVESIEQEGKPVNLARRGTFVGAKLSQAVRRNDKVYKMVPVEQLKNVQQ
jgi:putative protease